MKCFKASKTGEIRLLYVGTHIAVDTVAFNFWMVNPLALFTSSKMEMTEYKTAITKVQLGNG